MKKDLKLNREAWLRAAYALVRRDLLPEAPAAVAISWSFPSRGAMSIRKRRIGECHYKEGGHIGKVEGGRIILVSPTLQKPEAMLETIVHEAVHTVSGPEAGHRAAFSQLAARVGLVKPWTATSASPDLLKRFASWIKRDLPKWPGGYIMPVAKQKNRQLKAVCSCETPRILRASKATFEQGPILCGVCEEEFQLDV